MAGICGNHTLQTNHTLSYILLRRLRRRQIAPVVTCRPEVTRGRGWTTGRMATELLRSRVALPMKDNRFFFFQGKWCIPTKADSPTSPIVTNKCRGRWEAMIFHRVSSSHIPRQWSFFPWSFSVAHRAGQWHQDQKHGYGKWLGSKKRYQKRRAAHSIHVNRLKMFEEPWASMNNQPFSKLMQIGKLESLTENPGIEIPAARYVHIDGTTYEGESSWLQTTGRPETRVFVPSKIS